MSTQVWIPAFAGMTIHGFVMIDTRPFRYSKRIAKMLPVAMPILKILLFLCTGNYYRSRYAELLFNAIKPATLNWLAVSRGFAPTPVNVGPISMMTLNRLHAGGHAVPADPPYPSRLTEADLLGATRIIAVDAHEHPPYVRDWFPAWQDRIEYWLVADLDRMRADDALGLIETNIETLMHELTT